MIEIEVKRRRERISKRMAQAGVDWLVLGPGADFRYLSGVALEQSNRLSVLLIDATGWAKLIVPALEQSALANTKVLETIDEVDFWADSQNPSDLLKTSVGPGLNLLVNGDLWSRSLLQIQNQLSPQSISIADALIGQERIIKSDYEITELSKAASAINVVHSRVGEILVPGITERALAARLSAFMIEAGHMASEFVIVAAGSSAAEPHHEPAEIKISRCQPVVIDIGGPLSSGYFSDMTRMYCIGEPNEQAKQAIAAVMVAQELAVQAVAPGVMASTIDKVARDSLNQEGLGELFIHRVGHGIGLEVHEAPWLGAKDDIEIAHGMVFSIEPGVYMPGHWGVRIEDIVVATEDGARRLNSASHELVIV